MQLSCYLSLIPLRTAQEPIALCLNPTEAEESRPTRNNGQYSKHAPENARNDSLTAPSASAIEDDPRKRIMNQTQLPEIEPDSIYRSTQKSRNSLAIDIGGQCTDIKWLIACRWQSL